MFWVIFAVKVPRATMDSRNLKDIFRITVPGSL